MLKHIQDHKLVGVERGVRVKVLEKTLDALILLIRNSDVFEKNRKDGKVGGEQTAIKRDSNL